MGVSDSVLQFTTLMEEVSLEKVAITTVHEVQALTFCADNFIFEGAAIEVFPFIPGAFAAINRSTNIP